MKKIYIFIGCVWLILLPFRARSFGQEMLVDGDMENADAWLKTPLNLDAGNTVEFEFNYTEDGPTAGAWGCLRVAGTNTGTSGGNLTNYMFYQEVTLQRGVEYTFNCAYKDVRTNNYWFEVWVGGNEPADGSDYGADQKAMLVGGYKSTNWESKCPADIFDGIFLETACTPGGTNPFSYEGTGDTTVYFGFRMGIWDDTGGNYTFETLVDNVSLMGPVSAVRDHSKSGSMTIYPNPASRQLQVTGLEPGSLRIFDLTGREALQFKVTKRNMDLDVSVLEKGLYLIQSGNSAVKLVIE